MCFMTAADKVAHLICKYYQKSHPSHAVGDCAVKSKKDHKANQYFDNKASLLYIYGLSNWRCL